jgi:CRP-like cAMP-binding protein
MDNLSRSPTGLSIRNMLLAGLPVEEREHLRPLLTRVSLVSGQVLHERGDPIEDVFFMEHGLGSLTADTTDNGQVEVGLTGWEGMVGASVLLNPEAIAAHRAFVQIAGAGIRIRSADLRDKIELCPVLRERCLRYVHILLVQTAQSAACNARHELGERLARWLLMCRDRVGCDELPLTQEFLSLMLGVRRAGVSLAMSILQAGGLVSQARGRIIVLDRAGLEGAACECYRVVRANEEQIRAGSR